MISVIIPYNVDRGYLSQAIESVERQAYRNFELIVEHGDVPTSVNINNALKKSKGQYVKLLGEDSLLTENSLGDLREGIKGFDFVCANAINFSDAFDEFKENRYAELNGWVPLQKSIPKSLPELIKKYTIHGGTVLYSKAALYGIGRGRRPWDEGLNRAEEFDVHLRLLYFGYTLGYIDKTVCKYRIHPLQKCQTADKKDKKRIIELIKNRYGHGFNGNNSDKG